MKRNLDKEINKEDERITGGAVGFEQRMENDKKFKWIIYGLVVVGLGTLFGILAGTGVI